MSRNCLRREFSFLDVESCRMRSNDFSRPSLALELKEARARRLHRRMRTILLLGHRAHSLLATIREASGRAANARHANRIEIPVEVMLDHREMIGHETIVPGVIVRRDNETPQIAPRSIKRLRIGQLANNQKQTLPLVDRHVLPSLNQRDTRPAGRSVIAISVPMAAALAAGRPAQGPI